MKQIFLIAFFTVAVFSALRQGAAQEADRLRFNQHVRPILSQNCFPCHGFDAKQRKGDLRLDIPESAFADHGGTFPIKPGDLSQSELWTRITSADEELVMPPPNSNKSLSDAEKQLLRVWIEQGAPYQKHWAFEPPTQTAEPDVKNPVWSRNGVDRFVLQRLEHRGLAPQPEADKETLVRRVAFAITGLPPTVSEVDEFLVDESANAYESMVERYLRSPRYGEEMARHWLDVARYADTHGLHLDNERQMWAYRDWVVQAMNDNLPFDQFTTWQLAGDLLPNATPEQLVATGFSRCNVTTSEGGSIAPEFQYRYAVDRTSSMIQTWMGLTGGCAVCHDHKFDPLSTKEFYSLYAFFYSAADPAMDGNINVTAPFLKLPKPGQQEAVDSAAANEQTGRQQLEIAALDVEYMDPALQTPAPSPQVVVDILFDDFFPLGATTRNTSRNAHVWDSNPKFGAPSGRRLLRQANGFFYENIIQPQLKPITVPAQGKFCVWLRTDPVHTPKAVSIVFTAGTEIRRVIWGQPDVFSEANGKLVEKGTLPPAGEWTQLEVAADALDLGEGTQLTSLSLQQSGGIVWWDALTVSGESNPAADPLSSFSEWWKAQKGKSPPDVPIELQNILKDGPETLLSDELKIKLQKFYIGFVARPIRSDISRLRSDWEDARSARMTAEDAIQGTFIYQDVEQPRDAFVMLRGQYDKPGDKVEPNVPDILPRLKKEHEASRASRLDLANWLTAPDHPLTARVCANRIWQQIFGVGLVKTSFDFGSQGEPSSHPEMLDWLAIHFRESGWDVKGLVRLMVTSSTFRQQSRALPEVLLADPENRLYARGPRFRLDAEQIRDNALFASGLINLEMGGRGTRTYQPPNVWEPVGYSDSNTRYYLQDHGSALYRRSIYCFLKRTAPPPFMSNFDGPNREQPCSGRDRSNTPLQALQLMNDVQHFEAARALAERALEEGGASTESRITFLYRTVLARRPSGAEVESLTGALQQQLDLYRAEPEAAEKAIRVGESVPKMVASIPETAAWTMIANLVFNLDETLTRN